MDQWTVDAAVADARLAVREFDDAKAWLEQAAMGRWHRSPPKPG